MMPRCRDLKKDLPIPPTDLDRSLGWDHRGPVSKAMHRETGVPLTTPKLRASRTVATAATLFLAAALGAACGHTLPSAVADSTSTIPAKTPPADGTFGTMGRICEPGTPSGTPVRGITSSTIQIGVLNDAASSLSPGLGQVYLDVAKAFTGWCNAAGGINGRKIVFVDRDAQITQAAARIVDACQSDFMLVGGATPFDASTVQPREQCGLGSIPAYAASPQATMSSLQALPTREPTTQANVALFRLLSPKYKVALQHVGILAIDQQSLLAPEESMAAAIPLTGGRVTSFQKIPLTVTNFRTYIQPLVGTARMVDLPPADPTPILQAMNNVGYKPAALIDPIGTSYNTQMTAALEAAPIAAPMYIGTVIYPLSLASRNPATKTAVSVTAAEGPKNPVDSSIMPAWIAWVLFAKEASACGTHLTDTCVIHGAVAQHAYTGGGLVAPVDLSNPTTIGACQTIVSATAKGFSFDRALTRPTNGVFNCDPANVVKLPK
jgi:ABC-type branched-subunit amino acid transport system substrate-binding protein